MIHNHENGYKDHMKGSGSNEIVEELKIYDNDERKYQVKR